MMKPKKNGTVNNATTTVVKVKWWAMKTAILFF